MKTKATTATDLSWTITAGVTIHDCMQPPVAAVISGPNLEAPVPMDWCGGKVGGRHSFATSVTHRGAPLAQNTHDCGVLIPHVTLLPMPDPLTPLKILGSSRKVAFAAQRIRANKRPVALTSKLPLVPMLACGTLPLPVGINLTNDLASVDLGFTTSDLVAGWAEVAATMAASHFLSAQPGDSIGVVILKEVLKRALPPAVGLVRMAVTDDPVQVSWVENFWFFKIDYVIERNAYGGYSYHNYSQFDDWLVGDAKKNVAIPADADPVIVPHNPDEEPPL